MAHFKDLIISYAPRLFGKLFINKGATFNGVVECGDMQVGDTTIGSQNKGVYLVDGVLTSANEYIKKEDYSQWESKPKGPYIGTKTTLNGVVSEIAFLSTYLYTNPSSGHANGIELYTKSYRGTTRSLTSRNWQDMVVLSSSGVGVGDGTITLQRNGVAAGSFTTNQHQNATITIPNSVKFSYTDASYTTNFRTEAFGSSESNSYLSVIRNNVASVSGAPQYSAGLAWSYDKYNAYFMPNYNSPQAFIGGGSGNQLSWVKEVALYENIPSLSTKMGQSGSNATSAAFKTIFNNNVAAASADIGLAPYTLGYVNNTLSHVNVEDIADYLATKVKHTILANNHISRSNLSDNHSDEYWFTVWTASTMYQYDKTPIMIHFNREWRNRSINTVTTSSIFIDRDLCTQNRTSTTPSGLISSAKLPTLRLVLVLTQTAANATISFQGFKSNVTNLFGNNSKEIELPQTAISIPSSARHGDSDGGYFLMELTFHIDWTSSQIAANTSSGCFNRTAITYQFI